jgi:hypothetical protein
MAAVARRRQHGAAVACLLAVAIAGCGGARDAGRAAREGGGDPDRLTAPGTLVAATVGPPLYAGKNTDGRLGAGGRAVTYRAGGVQVSDPQLTALAPEARLFRTGFGSWEPTIGTTKDGTIFFAARNSNVDPGIVRSRDSGLTWQRVGPDAHRVSLDPFLWVDSATGRLFDSDIDPTVTCPPLSHSDDQGRTWSTHLSCFQADHQSVFGGPPPAAGPRPSGYPNVVYYCAISGGALAGSSTITGCSKSLDGGDSFMPTGDPAYGPKVTGDPNQPNCDGGAGHGIVDAKGTVYLPRLWCGPPFVAISHDEGATWTQVKVADRPQLGFSAADGAYPHESGIAADRAGNLYYTWVADDHHPHLAISRDGGRTWAAPLDVMPPGVNRMSAFTASIDAADPGKLAAVFMGTNDPPSVPLEKTRWNAYVVSSADALSPAPTFYGTTMNDPGTNALWVGDCADLRCGNVGDFLDIVIAPDGTPWAALVDSCPNADRCTTFGVTDPRGEAVAAQAAGGAPLIGTVADQLPGVSLPPAAAAPASSSPGPCRSRRAFRIRLREPRRGRLRSASVYIDGRRVRVVSGRLLRAPVDLRGLPAGRHVVKVVARTTTGRTLTRARRYRTCVRRRA